MQEFSFKIEKDLAPVSNDIIPANFDECKSVLTEMMSPYKKLIVTEDSIPQAKADLARIRKIKTDIEDMRKTVKRTYMMPVTAFESKCNELTEIMDAAAVNIDQQVKSFLASEVQEKIARLKDYFAIHIGDMSGFLQFEDIYNKRWENKTYSEGSAHDDIDRAIQQCMADVETINALGGEFIIPLLDMYRHTHDLHACIQKNRELMRQQEIAEHVAVTSGGSPHGNAIPKVKEQNELTGTVYELDFRVWVTQEQLNMLKVFLKTSHIKYGKVPEGDANESK